MNEQSPVVLPVWKWEEVSGMKILDPDGFRDLSPHWRDYQMTREDFERRVARSTIRLTQSTVAIAHKVRGFEPVKGYVAVEHGDQWVRPEEVHLPKRETAHAAGYDFEAAESVTIDPLWYGLVKLLKSLLGIKGFLNKHIQEEEPVIRPTLVKTGVKAYMPEAEALFLYNRSSNPLKRFLLLANGVGVVDSDYFGNPDNDGEIMFQFINFGLFPVHIKKGDRVGQGVFQEFRKADNDRATGERKGGHGSTDKEDTNQ